jgi:predicted PhzF superfamily epimerase YddE/YHI9
VSAQHQVNVVLHCGELAALRGFLDAVVEDPATGSGAAATIALLTSLRPERAESFAGI